MNDNQWNDNQLTWMDIQMLQVVAYQVVSSSNWHSDGKRGISSIRYGFRMVNAKKTKNGKFIRIWLKKNTYVIIVSCSLLTVHSSSILPACMLIPQKSTAQNRTKFQLVSSVFVAILSDFFSCFLTSPCHLYRSHVIVKQMCNIFRLQSMWIKSTICHTIPIELNDNIETA